MYTVYFLRRDDGSLHTFTWLFGLIPLYFPEDKTEYIPAFIQVALAIVAAVGVVFLFKRLSKKEEAEAKKIEEQMNQYKELKK